MADDTSKQEVTCVTMGDSNMYPTLTAQQLSAKGQTAVSAFLPLQGGPCLDGDAEK